MPKGTMQINYWTIGGFENAKAPEQALEEAAKMGFEGVELTFGGGEFATGIEESRCREIRRAARSMGMKIETLASGAYWEHPFTHPHASVRKKAVKFTKEYLQVAKWVGAKTVLVVPGAVAVPWDPSQPVVPYADAWKRATQAIRQVLPAAQKLGVSIGIENVWNMFLTDPMAMKTFVDQFDTARLGCYFDVANCLVNGYPEHWIELLGKKRIKAVHVKNFQRQDCGGVLHGFGDDIMKGDIDWKAVMKALDKIKYTGPITAEMIPFSRLPDMALPDMQMARDTAKKMKKILGR